MLGAHQVGLTSSGFAPTDIGGCKLWLRGDSLSVSGGNLTSGTDRSGNGNNVTPSGTIAYNASAINGRPGWTNTSGVWLQNTSSSVLAAGSARTIFVVAAPTGAGGPLFSLFLSGIGATYFAGNSSYTPFPAGIYTDSADGTNNALISPGSSLAPHVYEFTCATATAFVAMKVDGTAQSVSQGGVGCRAETGTVGFQVGGWPGGSAGFVGSYCEAIVFDSVLSSPNASAVRAALGAYYGITVV